MPGLAWSVVGTVGCIGYCKCPTVSNALRAFYLWLCWPQLKYSREWMEGKQTALLRVFSSTASAKQIKKNNKLIREMLKIERGRLQP